MGVSINPPVDAARREVRRRTRSSSVGPDGNRGCYQCPPSKLKAIRDKWGWEAGVNLIQLIRLFADLEQPAPLYRGVALQPSKKPLFPCNFSRLATPRRPLAPGGIQRRLISRRRNTWFGLYQTSSATTKKGCSRLAVNKPPFRRHYVLCPVSAPTRPE